MSISKAIEFSAKAHEGHFRKGSQAPYITHPFEVAKILGEAVDPEENEALIIAGLLHDTVEDTDTSLDTIRREFGEAVADLVASDSENKRLPWEARKQHTIDFLKNEATRDMQMLACADKLANLRSVKADYARIGEDVWDIFVRGKEKQAWYYQGVLDALAPLEGLAMYQELKSLVTEIFD